MWRRIPTVGVTCGVRGDDFSVRTAYCRALNNVGLAGVILPPQMPSEGGIAALPCGLCGLLLSGGGDLHPILWGEEPAVGLGAVDAARDEWELALTETAVKLRLPLLGICRGMQLLNVYFGGSLWQDLPDDIASGGCGETRILHSQTAPPDTAWHSVTLNERLLGWFGGRQIWVNSFHHQGVRRVGSGLSELAWAADGLVEAVCAPELPFAVGVQWHPEYLYEQEPLWREYATACFEYENNRNRDRDVEI